jgi:hypothetical protein
MAENPRTTTARDTDDHELIEQAVADSADGGQPTGNTGGSGGGGALARDVGSRDDLTRATADPQGHTRATKQDDIDTGQARPSTRGPDRQ